jgi:hypothetical protein
MEHFTGPYCNGVEDAKDLMMKEEPEPHFPRTWLLSVSFNQVHEAGIGLGLSKIIRLHRH